VNFLYHGIFLFDISSHQDSPVITGTVDFVKMRDFGARAVGLRATNGITKDADFDTFRANVKGVLPYFTYCYYNNIYPPKQQAQKYFDVIAPDMGAVCVLDLEDKQSGFIGWRHWYDWIAEFQRLSGLPDERIWLYTNETYFAERSGPITNAQRNWFSHYPLWLASYFSNPQHPSLQYVNVPAPWTEIVMLQSGTPPFGLQAGVESKDIDYNLFNGDEAKFASIFGGVPQPAPVETPVETGEHRMIGQVIVTSSLNIRQSAGTSLPAIGTLRPGDTVEASQVVHGWWRLTRITRAGANIPLPATECYAYEGDSQGYIRDITPPVEPPTAELPAVLWIGTTRNDVREYRKAE
jgi:GH25 family lysozyme M1 (1,4-beta-N-acetylmuramidase)